MLRDDGITVKPVGPLAPNLNAHCERVIQTIKHECLDHFVVFGEAHLRHLLSEFLVHYHRERPHQGIGNVPPSGALPVVDQPSTSEVVCDTRLGGLLKHYRRAA